MAFPRLIIQFSALLGADLQPRVHTSGSYLFQVGIDAAATIGVNGEERTRVSDATLNLTFPIQEGAAKVGALRATNREGLTFLGDVHTQDRALKLNGAIHDRAGVMLYRVDNGPEGKLQLAPVAPHPDGEGGQNL